MPIDFGKMAKEMRERDNAALLTGSPEQEAIWDYLRTGKTHAVVDAVAGSGKSTTLVQGVMRMRDLNLRIQVFAFNKHIADEMNNKFQAAGVNYATACTYNSFGWRACVRAYHPELDSFKTGNVVKEVAEDRVGKDNLPYNRWSGLLSSTRQLVSLCKSYLVDAKAANFADRIKQLAGIHSVDILDTDITLDLVPRVLDQCLAQTSIMDYDDQIWQVVVRGLPVDQFDVLMIDECQDTSKVQVELAKLACRKGRMIFVGDERQAIFGFRGAGCDSVNEIREELRGTERGYVELPLTITRRCPRSHVRLAQAIVPKITAMDNAPEGEIDVESQGIAIKQMRPGDLVLCRTNAPLVSVCYALLKANVKAVIRGRDIGTNLKDLIDKMKAGTDIHKLLENLRDYRTNEQGKLARLKERGTAKLQALNDQCECIIELTQGINSVTALKAKIDHIFADFDDDGKPRDMVVLGTVHRTKGLEAHVVFVLRPDLLPHPMAKQAWQVTQEANLLYVAVTRAKYEPSDHVKYPGRIVFIDGNVPTMLHVDAY